MSAPQAGISSTYGAATATKLVYTPLVTVDLENQAINLVDAQAYGHRVKLEVPVADLNGCFSWSRAAGDLFPVGATDAAAVKAAIEARIPAVGFVDLDSQATGLNFSSTALDSAVDPRLRASGDESANDLVMAYVLYRLYGKSSYETLDNIFNLEDAQGMLTDATLATAIKDSLLGTDGVASVKKMFRDLVSSDPQRFFDASGKQVSGIFETNGDVSGNGSWNLTAGDIIEVHVEFNFANTISRRDAADNQIETVGTAQNTTNVAAEQKFRIRLQLTAA
jgi:hypothetical protein